MKRKPVDDLILKALMLTMLSLGCSSLRAWPTINLAVPEKAPLQEISTQVLRLAYNELGYQVVLHKYPVARSIIFANEGRYDGEVSRVSDLESKYPNLKLVPTPINMINIVAIGDQYAERIVAIKDIQGGVACIKGIKMVEKLVRENNLQCSFVTGLDQALSMVSLGRVRYALLPELNVRIKLAKNAGSTVKILSPILHTENLYHYVHQKKLDMVEPLNRVLIDMKANGEIDQIRQAYLDMNL